MFKTNVFAFDWKYFSFDQKYHKVNPSIKKFKATALLCIF